MSPCRSDLINGFLIQEYWWSGEYVCYVDHRLSALSYNDTVRRLQSGKQPVWKEE
uniref:Uncharacterized protein n=1 Tax=Rubinisphaera brasiliensis (strain ATCC 49424 / DSM 5305 / JCM 21570 / IAM 15109 / NBRC 103401 / IFAM 1448) TaxID=756272 RepID=F0SNI4_RUBBR|nr:hypothetical protein Plabr_0188 [Rubinisphaera brasiliensis DSM 5305]